VDKDGIKLGFVLQRALRPLFGGGGLGVGRRELGFAVNKDGIRIWVCFVIGYCFAFSPEFPGFGFGGVFGGGRGLEGVDYGPGLVVAGEGEGAVGPGGFDLRLCAIAIHIYPTEV
jgi:hypothetical protein